MKQKEKWADEYVEKGRDGDDVVDAASYVGWLAGFEFAKEQIIQKLYRDMTDHYHTEVNIIEQIGEKEI